MVQVAPCLRAGQASISAAIAGRSVERLVAALLARANLHCVAVRLFSFRGRATAKATAVSRLGLQRGRARTRRHRADTCASVSCPAGESASLTPSAVLAQVTARTSALFRLHRWPDSPAFRPIHSLPHSASVIASAARTFAGCSRYFRRSQTAETGTDSGAPKDDNGGRDAPHIGQPPKYGREASPGQDTSNTARGFTYRR